MKRLNQEKIEKIIDELYWKAHADGRICGKDGKIDFGMAAITIESTITKFLNEREISNRVDSSVRKSYRK
jgi:hypothetical protein